MADISIQKVKTSALKLNKDNPRRISNKDMERLVKSLQEFPDMMGINPLLIGFRTLAKNVGGIYAIINSIDGRLYVGSAVSITNRMSIHKNELRRNRHHSKHLQNFYNKYGEECLAFTLLLHVKDPLKATLIKAEQFFLDTLKPAFNSNTRADSRMGCINSPVTRKRISESRRALNIRYDEDYKRRMSIALSGKNNPMYGKSPNLGKKHKPETIQKMIEVHRDVKGANNPKYGIPQSPEATKKARETWRIKMLAKGRGIKAVKNGEDVSIFRSAMEAAKELGICFSSIYRAIEKRQGRCKGYIFSFTGGQDGISQAINS